MNKKLQEIISYCATKNGVYEDHPFGKYPICYKINGKIFAQISPIQNSITLKTTPDEAYFYREQYPGIVVRGYHCPSVQQPYWNTIDLTGNLPEDLLFDMIDTAYELVFLSFSKKNQKKLHDLFFFNYQWTTGSHPDFTILRKKLDIALDELVGQKFQRQQYDKYNQPDNINDVLLVYHSQKPIACIGFKEFDPEHAELKRFYIDPDYRNSGLSNQMLLRIESRARNHGFCYMILETGKPLVAACHLYEKSNYKLIENYGPYKDMPNSICMQKKLQSPRSASTYHK